MTTAGNLEDGLKILAVKSPAKTAGKEWIPRSKWKKLKAQERRKREEGRNQAQDLRLHTTNVGVAGPSGGGRRPSKMKRQGTDPEDQSQQRPPKRTNTGVRNEGSHRSIANQQCDLSVIVHRADNASMDEATAVVVRQRLADLICDAVLAEVDGRCLTFVASGLVAEGFFLVTPGTEEARAWILGCDFGEHGGVPLRIRRLDRQRISIWLPGHTENKLRDPLKLIKGQNNYRKELKLDEWTLISKEEMPLGVKLTVGIPQDALKENAWLSYQATQVLARIIHKSAPTKAPTQGMECTCATCPVHKKEEAGLDRTAGKVGLPCEESEPPTKLITTHAHSPVGEGTSDGSERQRGHARVHPDDTCLPHPLACPKPATPTYTKHLTPFSGEGYVTPPSVASLQPRWRGSSTDPDTE